MTRRHVLGVGLLATLSSFLGFKRREKEFVLIDRKEQMSQVFEDGAEIFPERIDTYMYGDAEWVNDEMISTSDPYIVIGSRKFWLKHEKFLNSEGTVCYRSDIEVIGNHMIFRVFA